METKLYLYDSTKEDYLGKDLSEYLIIGDTNVNTLDEELDTLSLTLRGMPIRDEFAPSTKFILIQKDNDITKVTHWVVNSDFVQQPVMSNDNFFDHSIDFYEPSAIAQGRVVDNIAVTYKLQDVTLDETVTYPDINVPFVENSITKDKITIKDFAYEKLPLDYIRLRTATLFEWAWDNPTDKETWTSQKMYNQILDPTEVTLKLPRLRCSIPKFTFDSTNPANDFKYLGEVSYDIILTDTNLRTSETKEYKTINNIETAWNVADTYGVGIKLADNTTIDHLAPPEDRGKPTMYVKKLAEVGQRLNEYKFTMQPDHKYNILLAIHNFTSGDSGDFAYSKDVPYYENISNNRLFIFRHWTNVEYKVAVAYPTALSIEMTMNSYAQGDKKTIFSSAPPANAYDLFLKCQYASEVVKVGDELPYYVSDTDKEILMNTTIVENFYYQKNLWQMFIEIGKYIHSIPKVKFGQNGKFLVTWNRLGVTNKQGSVDTNNGVVSIFNSRNLENYVSACSSYINNAVQIGGIIEENIVANTNSDTYLVSNDTADFKVSKPIIEIVDLIATVQEIGDGYPAVGTMSDLAGKTIERVDYEFISDTDWVLKNGEYTFSKKVNLPYDKDCNIVLYDNIMGEEIPYTSFTCTNNNLVIVNSTNPTCELVVNQDTSFTNGFVFAKEIYEILDNEEMIDAPPLNTNKGRAIYYSQGSKNITGLTYRLPSVSSGSTDAKDQYAIKRILGLAFNIPKSKWATIKVNDFTFMIKYRTKDSLRNEQSRPDLRHYLLNNEYEHYPQHKQFNNQEDVVVDARKFGTHINGKLVKTGNTEFTMLEYKLSLSELKNIGELWRFDGNLYYISKVKNINYGSYITSEVTYSKDFNKLSEIVGIPSEPRFYEISEQSSIAREFAFNHYLCLRTNIHVDPYELLRNQQYSILRWKNLAELLFRNNSDQPKAVVSIFKDKSDELTNEFIKFIYSPLGVFTFHNTLSLEWDMVDNYSAGNKVIKTTISGTPTTDNAYKTLRAVGYKDKFGRADLLDFYICDSKYIENNRNLISQLPELTRKDVDNILDDISTKKFITSVTRFHSYDDNNDGLEVRLDNREVFKGNYNLQMITDSDRFVTSAYLWNINKQNVKVALLNTEVNKISNETIPSSYIEEVMDITWDDSSSEYSDLITNRDFDNETYALNISMSTFLKDKDLTNIKAIAFIDTKQVTNDRIGNLTYFVCARNVDGLSNSEKSADWYISYVDKEFFKKQ